MLQNLKIFLVEIENGQIFSQAVTIGVVDGNAHGDHQLSDSGGAYSGGQHSVASGGAESTVAGSNSGTVYSPAIAVQTETPQNSGHGSS
jgi:hypothetical protein